MALRMGRLEGRHCFFGACVKCNPKALLLRVCPEGLAALTAFNATLLWVCSLIGFGVATTNHAFFIVAAVAFTVLLGLLGLSINFTPVLYTCRQPLKFAYCAF